MAQSRINFVDRLKGLAIYCVVLGHVIVFGMRQRGDECTLLSIIISMNMPLFMFLSGFVVSKRMVASPARLFRRVGKLIATMLVFGGIYTFILGLTPRGFLMSTYKLGYWYLLTLATFYILLWPCARMWPRLAGRRGSLPLALAWGMAVWIALSLTKEQFFVSFKLDPASTAQFYLWPFFMSGWIVRRLIEIRGGEIGLPPRWRWLAGIIALLVYAAAFSAAHQPWAHCLVVRQLYTLPDFTALLSGAAAITLLALAFSAREHSRPNALERAMTYAGRNSLGIYVVHFYFIHALSAWGAVRGMNADTISGGLTAAAAATVILLAALISYKGVKGLMVKGLKG